MKGRPVEPEAVEKIVNSSGVNEETLLKWMKKYPHFKVAVEILQEKEKDDDLTVVGLMVRDLDSIHNVLKSTFVFDDSGHWELNGEGWCSEQMDWVLFHLAEVREFLKKLDEGEYQI
tara:strand:- start:3 stop:353 length:351 start_codon:yes stop_codon:yes gene_type:complete